MKNFNKNNARLNILNYIINFSTKNYYSDGSSFDFNKTGFQKLFGSEWENVPIGSLVRLESAPFSKWYLGWLLEKNGTGMFETKYLIESIDDGSLCDWSNVSLAFFDPKVVAAHPEWKWNDKQYKIRDQFYKACRKHLPYPLTRHSIVFHNDNSFTVNLGERWTNDFIHSKTFENYKKVLVRDFAQYLTTVKEKYEH